MMRLEHWLYTIPLRLRSLFRRARIEDELDEELRFHLEQRIAQEIAGGKTPEDARYIALQSMEGLEQRKEECRDMRRMNVLEDLQRNLRYAVRDLRRNPGFTAVTVITLALGIGSNSAIFSLVDTVMLKLLPVKTPEQLYLVGHTPQRVSMTWNYPDYSAMRDHNTVFTGLAGYSLGLQSVGVQSSTATGYAAELSYGIFVSGNYFDVLGVSPALGRVFNTTDDRAPAASPYVVLSYSYWQSHFNRDTQAIGRNLRINGYPFTVIGVAPRGFTGTDVALKPDLFVPIMMRSEVLHVPFDSWNDRHNWWMAAIGRLKDGVPIKEAEGELFAICKGQETAERRSLSNPKWADTADEIVLSPAAHGFSNNAGKLRKPLLILFVIVTLVLLIACANAANLMLARGASRQREIAVRLAMGASRWRVLAQLLTESLLIAALGGVTGIFVSLAAIRVLSRFTSHPGLDPANGIHATLDWRVVAFTVTVCVLTGILSGLAPAWQSTRLDLVPTLKEDVPESIGASRFTLRKALVILQVALSLPLLAGAALFVRTLGNLRGLDTGFAQENVFIASVDPTSFGYKGQRTRDFYDRLRARVAALPGVRSASLVLITPLSGSSWNDTVTVQGYTWKPGERRNDFWFNAVGPRYFETMGTPLLLGREFTEQDNPATALELPERIRPGMELPDAPGRHAAIVNETFARHFFGDSSAIGMHVAMGGAFKSSTPYEIVGVVKDAHYFSMRLAAAPMMFIPVWRRFAEHRELVIRTTGSTPQLAALLRREIHSLDPVIPLQNIRTLEHDVDESILVERLVATLSGLFGALALLLSAVGLYGVIAYTVTRRTHEIGIRIAIGAPRSSVLWLVLRDVINMVLIGALIGALAAFMATRAIAGILYGVSTQDPLSIIVAGFSLTVAALVASFLPARRAAKIDPAVALRYE
jgi:predicted permease